MSNLHALLIGVDFYFPHTLPGNIYYPSLGGCVRDVIQVETYLRERQQIPPEQIAKLTASNTGDAHPPEPPEQWPTYQNMARAFQALTERVQPDDQVYIHYSGHGGRARTKFPDVKGANGLDEGLVPTDIGHADAEYLRDLELAYLIQQLVDKGAILTVVFDSCHAGSATRGLADAARRGIEKEDRREPRPDSLVAPIADLVANWQQQPGATRGVKPASGWLLEPQGYTFLAACRANESAMEFAFNGRERSGALTHWLLHALRQAGPDWSYKMIHDRVLAKVHGQFASQTPQLQGETDRALFGSERIQPHFAVTVIESENGRVHLNAGDAHGVQNGDRFAIYSTGATAADFADPTASIAQVEVVEVDEVDAWARVEEATDAVEPGAQAILLKSVRLQRSVAICIDDETQRQAVAAAIAQNGLGFVVLAESGNNRPDVQVAVNARGNYEIWDPAGDAFANITPALHVDEPNAAAHLVNRLVHLARYYCVLALDPPDETTRDRLQVDLLGVAPESGETPVVRPGDQITLRVTNTQSPGAANDPARILNISILDLASDWSITQIFPTNTAFHPLDPGQTLDLPFAASLPAGKTQIQDTIKVFATQAATDFRWLELPSLDQEVRRSATRAAITDPLGQLLARVTEPQTTTRAITFAGASRQKRWTLSQVELHVRKE